MCFYYLGGTAVAQTIIWSVFPLECETENADLSTELALNAFCPTIIMLHSNGRQYS
jgi:hypothetical protein